jgi:hypothetical protein
MSIVEGSEGQLVVLPNEAEYIVHAKRLFANGEYFGAFARIHVLVEVWMENLYELNFAKTHTMFQSYERAKQGYRYSGLTKGLLKLGAVNGEEAERIQAFHDLRNSILHRMLKYSFKTYPWNIVEKAEAEVKFEDGLALCELLRTKCQGHWPMYAVDIPIRSPTEEPSKVATEIVFGNNASNTAKSTPSTKSSQRGEPLE